MTCHATGDMTGHRWSCHDSMTASPVPSAPTCWVPWGVHDHHPQL